MTDQMKIPPPPSFAVPIRETCLALLIEYLREKAGEEPSLKEWLIWHASVLEKSFQAGAGLKSEHHLEQAQARLRDRHQKDPFLE